MRNGKHFVVGIVAALIALAAGFFIGMESHEEHPPAVPSVSVEAIARLFATRLNDVAGKPKSFTQWQGKTLVVNFWATWCQPCREEMPSFSRLQAKHAAKDVQFIGIAIDSADNVRIFSKEHPVSYPLLLANDEGIELTRELGNSRLALPYTLVLGSNGEPLLTRLGRVPEQELDTLLQKATDR